MNGSLTLSKHPGEIVQLKFEKCGRAGQYRKAALIKRFGADMRLPDLGEEIAQCDRHRHMHDPCRVHSLTGGQEDFKTLGLSATR
jgi:hypothetical protein